VATGRRDALRVLVAVAFLVLAILVVWDLTAPDSVLRELFQPRQGLRDNAREILEDIRDRP